MKSALFVFTILTSFNTLAVTLSDGVTIDSTTSMSVIQKEASWGRLRIKESEIYFGAGDSTTSVPYSNICLNSAGEFQTKLKYPTYKKVAGNSGKAMDFKLVQNGTSILTSPTSVELPVNNIKHDGNKVIIGTPLYGQTATYTYPMVGIVIIETAPTLESLRGKAADPKTIFTTSVALENCAD